MSGFYDVLIMTAKSDEEANLVIGILADRGIPVEKKHRGLGHSVVYLQGLGYEEIDLYVSHLDFERAKDLIYDHSEGMII